jgi:hypothetical protein
MLSMLITRIILWLIEIIFKSYQLRNVIAYLLLIIIILLSLSFILSYILIRTLWI